MKKIYIISLVVSSMLYYGCGNKKSTEGVVKQETINLQPEVVVIEDEKVDDGIANIPRNERHNNHNSLDIETFTIGDYIFIYRYSYKIGNEAITVLDKQGKMIAIAASAQQTVQFSNFIRYLYDEEGNHIGFAHIGDTHYPENMKTFNMPYKDCEHFDYLYYDVCVRKPDDVGLVRYMFRYDDTGVLKGIYDPIHGYVLNAPEGAHIKWRIEKGASFWESDLRGGEYYLMFYIIPIGKDLYGNSICYDVYEGYEPYDYIGDDGQY